MTVGKKNATLKQWLLHAEGSPRRADRRSHLHFLEPRRPRLATLERRDLGCANQRQALNE